MLEPILLIGAGGHAVSCIDVIEQEEKYKIVGLLGLSGEVGGTVLGYPILGTDSEIPVLVKQYSTALISLGQIKTPEYRIKLFDHIKSVKFRQPAIISPFAYVSAHAKIGEGTIVMHGAIINAGVVVGRNCIINSHALLEHGVSVGDHCHISTSSAVNSGVSIGRGTFIGSGSRVRQSLTIGENCIIGMGQVVITDCADGTSLPMQKENK